MQNCPRCGNPMPSGTCHNCVDPAVLESQQKEKMDMKRKRDQMLRKLDKDVDGEMDGADE